MVKKNEKMTIDARVREIAKNGNGKGVGMPNWFALPQNKERRARHIEICKKLVELSEKHADNNGSYPITYMIYFAIGKNAHRIPVFLGGYDEIDETKAEKIFSWLEMFAKFHKNPKLFRNPNVAHALCRFYDKFSTKTKDFTTAMKSMEKNPNIDVKNAKAIVNGLGIAKQTNETELEEAEAETAVVPAVVEV